MQPINYPYVSNVKARYKKHTLCFKQPSGTSRGILNEKDTWFIFLKTPFISGIGIGECSPLKGLSIDDVNDYEEKIDHVCLHIDKYIRGIHTNMLDNFPSIQFGLEMALLDLQSRGTKELFPSLFTQGKEGIPINGLVWMGEVGFMQEQINQKIAQGFQCIKIKIGALNFEKEYGLLASIRRHYSKEQIEIRVDANGAFSVLEAPRYMARLAQLDIHSIEQPIGVNQPIAMSRLCQYSRMDIALDEELIGIRDIDKKNQLLGDIQPRFIIIKPSLIGGYKGAIEWIKVAQSHQIDWWITSALESNIGLNAIAQWCYTLNSGLPQGLGTGQLYTNNISSPLSIRQGHIWYAPKWTWQENIGG